MEFIVYLAGEIHTNWREEIKKEALKRNLPYRFVGPMENHSLSDHIGEQILGKQPGPIYKDMQHQELIIYGQQF